MTNELQNDEVIEDLPQETEIVDQDTGVDSEPTSEVEHEENQQNENVDQEAVNQEAINKVINKKHFEAKEAERKAAELQQRLDEYEAKQREEQAKQFSTLPEMPDPFDDDYDVKMQTYAEQLRAQAAWQAQQDFIAKQQLSQKQEQEAKKLAEAQQKVTKYSQRAKEYGISEEQLKEAGDAVVRLGVNDDLIMTILDDPDGPLITRYLASNPQDVSDLSSMNPYLAGTKLVEIKQKASALKPKTSNTPNPATAIKGQSVDSEMSQYKHIGKGSFN